MKKCCFCNKKLSNIEHTESPKPLVNNSKAVCCLKCYLEKIEPLKKKELMLSQLKNIDESIFFHSVYGSDDKKVDELKKNKEDLVNEYYELYQEYPKYKEDDNGIL